MPIPGIGRGGGIMPPGGPGMPRPRPYVCGCAIAATTSDIPHHTVTRKLVMDHYLFSTRGWAKLKAGLLRADSIILRS
jgi:hypothetical protein